MGLSEWGGLACKNDFLGRGFFKVGFYSRIYGINQSARSFIYRKVVCKKLVLGCLKSSESSVLDF